MTQIITNTPVCDQDIDQVTEILSRFEPGFLPLPIFLQITRLTVTTSIEMVPFMQDQNGKLLVLLTKRSVHDTLWPSMWHNPGTVLRSTDKIGTYDDAFLRIFNEEIGVIKYTEPVFAGAIFHKTRRGAESPRIFWTELQSKPKNGQLFDVDALPADMIESHVKVVQLAAENYRQHYCS